MSFSATGPGTRTFYSGYGLVQNYFSGNYDNRFHFILIN